ncbi:MAG: tRNA (N(6)-L-threonylcarbamoyladenosine(37)-C(2))-methylthiotransferase MtaB, partial [Planctomycetota bacterium]|nr:tRNA (N(6)-L-threonylcarbamoyladenosine(37)-C(2))-methylthiotransferase MtaB [Planctomycetota bacterium]
MAQNFFIYTLGCKTNQYESQGMREALVAAGLSEVQPGARADLAVVNTCAVTSHAEASSRRHLRKALRSAERIALTGCAVDLGRPWTLDLSPRVIRIGNRDKHRLAAALGLENASGRASDFPFSLRGFAGHRRAFIKIQDGCAGGCSYCVVPLARGAPRSRPLSEILEEGRQLIANGYRELVLTGINIGAYRGPGGEGLAAVVSGLAALPGLYRLRLGSVEPQMVDDALLASMRHPAVCPHLHLPLQSGDDAILRAMGRPYSAAEFMAAVERIRQALDQPALTADVIVGFPGEGEREFANTLAICEAAGFSRLHVFRFSPRPGTAAALLPRPEPPARIAERERQLLGLAQKAAAAFARQWLGREVEVYVESWRQGTGRGYTDRYVRVAFPCSPDAVGRMVRLRPHAWREPDLWAPTACFVSPSLIHSTG